MWWIMNTETTELVVGYDLEDDAQYALDHHGFNDGFRLIYVLLGD